MRLFQVPDQCQKFEKYKIKRFASKVRSFKVFLQNIPSEINKITKFVSWILIWNTHSLF